MSDISDLIKRFQYHRLLKSDPQTKSIALLGSIHGKDAIITLEKTHFLIPESGDIDLQTVVQEVEVIQNNDIYYWSKAKLNQSLSQFPGGKLNLIYPATEIHIKKYGVQKYHYIKESPEVYNQYVVPYINTMKGDRIKWVYNILFEGKESESFIHHDKDPLNGFVLLPDMKWDGMNLDALYLCCIVNRKDILSVRDLDGSHLEFLTRLQSQLRTITCEHYPGIDKDELRIFIHYQPSYYHFHIHVVTTKHSGLGDGINIGKAILLDDIIENIKLMSDYYHKRTLGYVIGENHDLWKLEGFKNQTKP